MWLLIHAGNKGKWAPGYQDLVLVMCTLTMLVTYNQVCDDWRVSVLKSLEWNAIIPFAPEHTLPRRWRMVSLRGSRWVKSEYQQSGNSFSDRPISYFDIFNPLFGVHRFGKQHQSCRKWAWPELSWLVTWQNGNFRYLTGATLDAITAVLSYLSIWRRLEAVNKTRHLQHTLSIWPRI